MGSKINKYNEDRGLMKQIFLQVRSYWKSLILIFILHLLSTPIALLKPIALKILIDSGFGNQPLPPYVEVFVSDTFSNTFQNIIVLSAIMVIVIAIINQIHSFVVWVYTSKVGEKMVLTLRSKLFNHTQRLSLSYHDNKGSSDSLYRIQYDATSIRTFFIGNISSLVSAVVGLIAMSVVMFSINWRFALISFCVMPPLILLIKFSKTKLKSEWKKVKEDESRAMSVANEVLSSLRIVKAFGKEDSEGERFVDSAQQASKGQIRVAYLGAMFDFAVGLLFAFGTALFIYYGAILVHNGSMTLGELTQVIAYLALIYSPLEKISKNINDIQSSLTSLKRIFSILDKEKDVEEAAKPIIFKKAKGDIVFEQVSFFYNSNRPTLENISFTIAAGDRIGIMGTTGAGKSTLINLLCRFYDPVSGNIYIDGHNIKELKLKDYRNQFAMVLQEPVLFSNSIGENIAYGNPNASKKDIIEAAKNANAHDFIIQTKDGYDTLVGYRGMQLSGGERQRISIARAFIKNAPILILDEPTSSLDLKTESRIMEAIQRLMSGRTTFLITHRLDTLKTCNVIIHLENGKLVDVSYNSNGFTIQKKKDAFIANSIE